eukprot:1823675-Rhodomonas_salina.2
MDGVSDRNDRSLHPRWGTLPDSQGALPSIQIYVRISAGIDVYCKKGHFGRIGHFNLLAGALCHIQDPVVRILCDFKSIKIDDPCDACGTPPPISYALATTKTKVLTTSTRTDNGLLVPVVHGFCGMWGIWATGIFCTDKNVQYAAYPNVNNACGRGEQFGVQVGYVCNYAYCDRLFCTNTVYFDRPGYACFDRLFCTDAAYGATMTPILIVRVVLSY